MPLHWEEIKKGLKISDFNIRNAIPRLKEHGDLFNGVLGKAIDIPKALKSMADALIPLPAEWGRERFSQHVKISLQFQAAT